MRSWTTAEELQMETRQGCVGVCGLCTKLVTELDAAQTQTIQRSVKEIQHTLPEASEHLLWELAQRPRTTIRDVADVIQKFSSLQASNQVHAMSIPEVTNSKRSYPSKEA